VLISKVLKHIVICYDSFDRDIVLMYVSTEKQNKTLECFVLIIREQPQHSARTARNVLQDQASW
jgi:hypothetical protein